MIHFEINGKRVKPDDIGDALTQAILQGLKARIRESIGSLRDPETGAFPTVVMRGDTVDSLHMHVEGSSTLRALVRERILRKYSEDAVLEEETPKSPPQIFFSYTSEDTELAERLATALQANGIDTWWDKWCITSGDSLRQKIDEGLNGCTHFLVLLTPQSINKPWVNQEMDAGLVRKLQSKCRFLPVRHNLPPKALPPLLSGIHAPEIAADEDVAQLINDIHGISRKPKLGPHPHAETAVVALQTGYSTAANAIARYFVEATKYGCFGDPIIDVEPLAKETALTIDDTRDALFELSAFFKDSSLHALVQPSLFTEFDRHWKPWDPFNDALRLAADLMNDPEFPDDSGEIAARYGWEPRRFNPAANYLFERDLVVDYRALNHPEYELYRIVGKADELRRFLKGRC